MKLTGRTRYRTGWRGKIILQVEYTEYYCHDIHGSGHFDEGHTTHWRDATADDLINGEVTA